MHIVCCCVLLLAAIIELGVNAQTTGPVLPLNSISIYKGIYFAADAQQFLFYRVSGGSWNLLKDSAGNVTKGVAITAFGNSNIAIASNVYSQLFMTSFTVEKASGAVKVANWVLRGGAYLDKIQGTQDTSVLYVTTKTKELYLFQNRSGEFAALDAIVDFTVRDYVYATRNTTVCARRATDWKCAENPPFSFPYQVAASDTNLFVFDSDGVLYSTVLPLETTSAFFNTGFTSNGVKSIIVPIDGNEPVILDASGSIQSDFCKQQGVNCFSPPPDPKTLTTSPASTSAASSPATSGTAPTNPALPLQPASPQLSPESTNNRLVSTILETISFGPNQGQPSPPGPTTISSNTSTPGDASPSSASAISTLTIAVAASIFSVVIAIAAVSMVFMWRLKSKESANQHAKHPLDDEIGSVTSGTVTSGPVMWVKYEETTRDEPLSRAPTVLSTTSLGENNHGTVRTIVSPLLMPPERVANLAPLSRNRMSSVIRRENEEKDDEAREDEGEAPSKSIAIVGSGVVSQPPGYTQTGVQQSEQGESQASASRRKSL
ncbi:hypothetical protein HDU97_005403 [Phlyctochytrium planicorne]|nr:hypothetical protein HDU97_005403 [Phlyctochytrium planicorne]